MQVVSKVIEDNKSWEFYKDLGRLAKKNHPKTLLFDFFTGKYFKKLENQKKLLKLINLAILI